MYFAEDRAQIEIRCRGDERMLFMSLGIHGLEISMALSELERIAAYLAREVARWRASLLPPLPNHYAVLGVARDASPDAIKKSYRALAKEHHPDGQVGDEEQLKRINVAYEVLSDAEKRRKYDQYCS
jgi:DnaJ-domain-containing protein 1